MGSGDSRIDTDRLTVRSAVVPKEDDLPKKSPPLYLSIHARISEKITDGVLPEGAVIKEGPLASVFGVSRAPVRRALHMLSDEDILRPANGQGFVIGCSAENAVLSQQQLAGIFQSDPETRVGREATWESIYDSVLLDVTNCLPFGTFRISEVAACEHFSVGRTALREGLRKLQDNGFLEKSNRSHWIAGPLTARVVHEAFEVRRLLEPAAFRQSAPGFDKATIQAMRQRVADVLNDLPSAAAKTVEGIEDDLHRNLLTKCSNSRLIEAIERNQFPFIVNRIFRRNFGVSPDRAALEDHVQILDQLLKNQTDVACKMLEAHLESAEKNTLAKLRVLSILPKPATAPYLINVH